MISKSKISQIRSLHLKKNRDEQKLFIVEGIKSCTELIHSNLEVIDIFLTEKTAPQFSQILNTKQFMIISENEMERMSCLKTTPEILCIAKIPSFSISDLEHHLPLLILDEIKDPGNMGTIIRNADWFGITQIFCSDNSVEFTNPKVIQATMGSFTRIKMVNGNIVSFLSDQQNRNIYGMVMDGEPIEKTSFHSNDIIIIGNESHGISVPVLEKVNQKILIPHYTSQSKTAESLNASVATGIVLYEFSKQISVL
jgi:TrmH family RNA methyltransferase